MCYMEFNYKFYMEMSVGEELIFLTLIVTHMFFSLLQRKVGELYVGGMTARYGVLNNVKNLQDLNNKIIECKFENNSWVFMRERTDKSFPNSFETAESEF